VEVSPREDALRIMEAARVYRALDKPWVIVTGGVASGYRTEAERMKAELELMGVPADRIVCGAASAEHHEHAIYVPPLLRERHVTRFVLVTSRQHVARALGYSARPGGPGAVHTGSLRGSLHSHRSVSAVKERAPGQRAGALQPGGVRCTTGSADGFEFSVSPQRHKDTKYFLGG
jgi:uncharacterized SAM-binding protein YcdF (DUF218 family)